MEKHLSDAQKAHIRRDVLRLLLAHFSEGQIAHVTVQQAEEIFENLDAPNRGRLRYVGDLADFLHDALMPYVDALIEKSREIDFEHAEAEAEDNDAPLIDFSRITEELHDEPEEVHEKSAAERIEEALEQHRRERDANPVVDYTDLTTTDSEVLDDEPVTDSSPADEAPTSGENLSEVRDSSPQEGETENVPPGESSAEKAVEPKTEETSPPVEFVQPFRLPLAQIGESYRALIDPGERIQGDFRELRMIGEGKLRGLHYEPETRELKGIPEEFGRFEVTFTYLQGDETNRLALPAELVVLPDTGQFPEKITLPPAIADQAYRERLPIDMGRKRNVKLSGLTGIELDYDAIEMIVRGTPHEIGSHELNLTFGWEGLPSDLEHCITVIIEVHPGTQTFTEKHYPDRNLPYPKSLEAHESIVAGPDKLMLGASRRGPRNAHHGNHRNDDFRLNFHQRLNAMVLAVASGHKLAPYGRKGAELATKVAEQVVMRRLESRAEELPKLLKAMDSFEPKFAHDLPELLPYTLTTAAYNAHRYLLNFSKSENEPLEAFATDLQVIMVLPVNDKQFMVAGITIGESLGAILDTQHAKLLLFADPGLARNHPSSRLISREELVAHTRELNRCINWYIVDDFDCIASMTPGVVSQHFALGKKRYDVDAWELFWLRLREGALDTGGRSTPDARLLEWLEEDVAGAYSDRTLALVIRDWDKFSART